MWCTASSPLPGVVPWLLHPQLLLSQSLHQNVLSKTILTPACGLAASPVTLDMKISCSCYISSFCLLPPPSSLEGHDLGGQVHKGAYQPLQLCVQHHWNTGLLCGEVFNLNPTGLFLLPLDLHDGVWHLVFLGHASKKHLSCARPTQPSSLKQNIYVQNLRCKLKITDDDHNIIFTTWTL